jgi:hypothetical protein
MQQHIADGAHVQRARTAVAQQLRQLQRRLVEGETPELDSSRPPARWRQAPTRAGRQAMARTALPPPRARCMP